MPDPKYRFVHPDHEHRRFLRLVDWFAIVSCVYLIEGWAIARSTKNDVLLWLVGATAILVAGFGVALIALGERGRGLATLAAVSMAVATAALKA